jgi:SM-20-related protein
MPIQVIDDFLPADEYAKLVQFVTAQPMGYGSRSNSRTDPHGHWSWKPIHDNRFNLADLTAALPASLLPAWTRCMTHLAGKAVDATGPMLIRCYANGYTYGTDGYFHTDSSRADETTCIIYICEGAWEPDWAGETAVMVEPRGIVPAQYHAVLPKPNRALFLPSTLLHAARAVSRKCTTLRTTLMFKTRAQNSPSFERLSSFLTKSGALSVPHGTGTLHDHLMRSYSIASLHGCSERTALGAGLHSIYGTNAFRHALFSPTPDNRARIAGEFGKEAENLAYHFSVIDRPQCLEYADKRGLVGLRYLHDAKIPEALVHDLQLIEAANLLDQNHLGKWPNIKRVWEGEAHARVA